MPCIANTDDLRFRDQFESGEISTADFSHRNHLRLAFVYLTESDTEEAGDRMRAALLKFLDDNNVPAGKFHKTLTISWIMAVKHFMQKAESAASFEEFIAADDRLLDPNIMLTHYSRDTLFSETARTIFVAPDVQAIPQYA